MKGQIEKIETRSDNVIKFSVTVQPEAVPANIMNWRFQNIDMNLWEEGQDKNLYLPEHIREGLKMVAAMLLDFLNEDKPKETNNELDSERK